MQIPSIGVTDEMKFHHGCFVLWILIAICAALASAATELSFNSTINATFTNADPNGTTPSPAHPSVHLLTTVPLPGRAGELDRSSAAFGQKAESPLDGSTPPTTDNNGDAFRTATPPPGDAISLNTDTMADDYPMSIKVSTEAQPAPSVQPVPMSEGK